MANGMHQGPQHLMQGHEVLQPLLLMHPPTHILGDTQGQKMVQTQQQPFCPIM